jgi:hypothetical protein
MDNEPEFAARFTLDEIRALMAAALFAQDGMDEKPASLDDAWNKLEALLSEHEEIAD